MDILSFNEKRNFITNAERVYSYITNQKDFEDLAEIMKDPASYDKYGITTGIISNKSKSIFAA